MSSERDFRRHQWLILLAFAGVYLCWGSSFVAIRYGVKLLHPAFVAGLRYVLAGSVLLGVLAAMGHRVRVSRREARQLALLALIMFTCNTVLMSYGSVVLSAGMTALILATIPLFMGLFESVAPGGQSMGPVRWAGTLAGFAGLLVLLHHRLAAQSVTSSTGLACAALIGAAISWAFGSVLARRMKFEAPTLVCSAWQMLIGGTVNLGLGVALGGLHSSHWTRGAWLAMLYLALVATLGGFTSYMFLLRNVSLASAATYAYVNPVVAVLLGWVFLGERRAGAEWAGMAIVLASVALVLTRRPPAESSRVR